MSKLGVVLDGQHSVVHVEVHVLRQVADHKDLCSETKRNEKKVVCEGS